MPVDTSDYIKKTRLLAIANGKQAAASRKFRALTQHDTYDPYRITEKTIRTDDFKSPVPYHNTFGAKQVSADKQAHFNRVETVVIPSGYCSNENITLTAGVTYNVINNANYTDFDIIPPIGSGIYLQIPLGQSQLIPAITGRLLCD